MTRRLLVSYLAVTILVLAILEIPLGIVYRQREVDQLTTDIERDATVLATLYEDALEERLAPDPVPADDYSRRTGARVVIVDGAGISIIDTHPDIATDRDFSTRDEMAAALTGNRATGTRGSSTLGTDLLYVAVPVASGGNVWGAVRVTLDAHEVNERVQRFWLALAAVAVVILTAMTLIGWAIARSVTRPVRRLQAAASRFARGELSEIAPDRQAPPELRDLQRSLNTMARQLDELLQEQRAFVADASHQLRTPLTAIRLRLENLQSEVENVEHREEIEASIAETTRLAGLVGDLLLLARAERYPAPVPVDLSRVVAERVDVWTAIADQAGVGITLVAPDAELTATAVPGGVEQILDNLIDNAITASPPGATITIELVPADPTRRLLIADQGAGLTDEQKGRALVRFWRGSPDTAGTGLGLAIVNTLVSASQGTITIGDNEPTGLVVTVDLPAAPGGGQ